MRVVKALAAVMHQDMQDDVLDHAHAEVAMDHARNRHVRQFRIGEQVIDAGAQCDNGFQIGKAGQQSVRRPPYAGHADVRGIADVIRPEANIAARRVPTQKIGPRLRAFAGNGNKNGVGGHAIDRARYCATTPSGAVSRLKAAANSARV